ncbi:alanine racemase [Altericroceibacterium xinjiangense]|uniref:alanine racemase n=1 Tax=Altericroceibacterium xinjiangense TaxID=762261 RepID=UPI003B9765E3
MHRPDAPPPTLRLRIDEEALASNWRTLDRLSGSARAGAAVKADAYGLSAAKVIPVLRDAGANDFFVAHWGEVGELLDHVPASRISVLHGPANAQDSAYARALGVRPVINSLHQAKVWIECGGGPCDLMIDTGMNRLGVRPEELGDPLAGRLEIETALSHLASADEDSALNPLQLSRATQAFAAVSAKERSLANSAGIALGKDYAFDLTRPGLALYGGVPRGELAGSIRQVVTPEAAILQVRTVQPGETIGYNATFTADRPVRAGIVSIGYADGFLRCWSGKGVLRAGEADLPLLGRVSMDMAVIDLSQAPHLREGDWVEIPWHLPEAAARSGLSQYELLTTLGHRFSR